MSYTRFKATLKFNPVGEGLFFNLDVYTEKGRIFSTVYDCGSTWPKHSLEKAIKNYTHGRRLIDLLTLSHLHQDHVNGTVQLMQKLKVGTVMLPYISPNERLKIHYITERDGHTLSIKRRFM